MSPKDAGLSRKTPKGKPSKYDLRPEASPEPAPAHLAQGKAKKWRGTPMDAHEWVSFEDPLEQRTWRFDITFLTSHWECIFGRGCQGVLTGPAPELVQGCCSYGAHFTGPEDVARVRQAARTLTPQQWQFSDRASRGVTRRQAGGVVVTRMVEDACIFLNRPGFPGGAGCALHRAALERGAQPLEYKPDVCWQLPLRREDVTHDNGWVTSTVTQWDRVHWGPGGDEFAWWCTEAPEAFSGPVPVWQHMQPELEELCGKEVMGMLTSYLEARPRRGSFLPHPTVRHRHQPEPAQG